MQRSTERMRSHRTILLPSGMWALSTTSGSMVATIPTMPRTSVDSPATTSSGSLASTWALPRRTISR